MSASNLIKEGLGIFIHPSGTTGTTVGQEPIAYAQSYSLDVSAEQTEITSL